MLDLSAVFDTVDQYQLICILRENFNIIDKVLGWLKSYLENRTFSAVLKGIHTVVSKTT